MLSGRSGGAEMAIVDPHVTTGELTVLSDAATRTLDLAIAAWLDSKAGKSQSVRTRNAYEATLASFRGYLRALTPPLDLDDAVRCPLPRRTMVQEVAEQARQAAALKALSAAAQVWAKTGLDGRTLSAATMNQRLAIVSSFYVFVRKRGLLVTENPIATLERATVQSNRAAAPITDGAALSRRLRRIDRSTLQGLRDYALLAIALQTGRRRAEMEALHLGDVEVAGATVTLTWRRCKGGKTMRDQLEAATAQALLTYLRAVYGEFLGDVSRDAPVWVSCSRRNPGAAIQHQTFANICATHLGTSRFHTTRHTFAYHMLSAGAPVTVIQQKLGHESLATTQRYLGAVAGAVNPFAEQLAETFGIVDPAPAPPAP
jgi:site-specific recombinase XerD